MSLAQAISLIKQAILILADEEQFKDGKSCKNCKTGNVVKHGLDKKGIQLYKCRNEECSLKTFKL